MDSTSKLEQIARALSLEEKITRIAAVVRDAVAALSDRIRGVEVRVSKIEQNPPKDGKTPQKGVDYLTDTELETIRTQATPQKGKDYFTAKEAREFKREVTPRKGIDYRDGKDGKDGRDGKNGKDGKPGVDGKDGQPGPRGLRGLRGYRGEAGKDGKDGSSDTPFQIVDKLESLEGNDRLSASAIKDLPRGCGGRVVDAEWGDIRGSVANQTDLVEYIEQNTPDPTETDPVYTAEKDTLALKSELHVPVTAGTGIAVSGQQVSNADTGSKAVSGHEDDFDHSLIETAVQAESDPVYASAPAASITSQDISNLSNLSGVNSGDQESSDFDHNQLQNYTPYQHADSREGFEVTRDGNGDIEQIEYESGKVVQFTREGGVVVSWTDGVYEWTIIRDGDMVSGVDVNLIS